MAPSALLPWFVLAASTRALLVLAPDRASSVLALIPAMLWWTLSAGRLPRRLPSLGQLLLLSGGVHLLLVGAPPHWSDDVHRYLVEGATVATGHNPFLTPPAEATWADPTLVAGTNHGSMTSIYPPIALAWFAALHLLGGTVLTAQVATSALNVGLVAVIFRRWGPAAAWLWATSPLPVLHAAVGAHLELPALTLAVLGLALPARWGTVATALAGGTKLLPFAWWPPQAARHVRPALAGLGLVLLGLLPFLAAGTGLTRSLVAYATHWSFNGALAPWLTPLLGTWTRPALALLGLGWWLHALRTCPDPLHLWRRVALGFVLCTPTLHPWYALWWFAPAVLTGDRWGARAASWLLVGYGVLSSLASDGVWSEPAWLWPLTWGPVGLMWLLRSLQPLPATSE